MKYDTLIKVRSSCEFKATIAMLVVVHWTSAIKLRDKDQIIKKIC